MKKLIKGKSKSWEQMGQEYNEQAKKEGRLGGSDLKEGEYHVVFFRKNPKYPKPKNNA